MIIFHNDMERKQIKVQNKQLELFSIILMKNTHLFINDINAAFVKISKSFNKLIKH